MWKSRLLIVICVSMVGIPSSMPACTCMTPTLEDALRNSSLVFKGTVIAETRGKEWWEYIYTFRVDKQWKGLKQPTFLLSSSRGGACDRRFDTGHQYVVFVQRSGADIDTLHTSICEEPCCLSDGDTEKKLDFLTGRGVLAFGTGIGAMRLRDGVAGLELAARLGVVLAPHLSIRTVLGYTRAPGFPSLYRASIQGQYRLASAFEAVSPYLAAGPALLRESMSGSNDIDMAVACSFGVDLPFWSDQIGDDFDNGFWSTLSLYSEGNAHLSLADTSRKLIWSFGCGIQILL